LVGLISDPPDRGDTFLTAWGFSKYKALKPEEITLRERKCISVVFPAIYLYTYCDVHAVE
jgi:hypothetical protein